MNVIIWRVDWVIRSLWKWLGLSAASFSGGAVQPRSTLLRTSVTDRFESVWDSAELMVENDASCQLSLLIDQLPASYD